MKQMGLSTLMVSIGIISAGGLLSAEEAGSKDTKVANKVITIKIGKIDWYSNYDDAIKVAQKEQKPLWLHFGENPG